MNHLLSKTRKRQRKRRQTQRKKRLRKRRLRKRRRKRTKIQPWLMLRKPRVETVEKAEKKTKKRAKNKKPAKTTLSKKPDPEAGKKKAVKRPAPAEPAPADPEEAPAPKRRPRNAKLEALKKQMAEDKKKHPPPTFSDESSEEDSGQDDDYSQSSDDDREPVPEVPTSLPDLNKTAPHGTPGNKSKNGIGQRHLLLKRVNRQLRQALEEMEDRILRVGQLGDYDAGRHTRNVKLTPTVESYDTTCEGQPDIHAPEL